MKSQQLLVIGWREWLDLPELEIANIKAKIDTGARSSALHAFGVESFQHQGQEKVRFHIHPYQRNTHYTFTSEANLLEWRHVKNSGGQAQLRPVIRTLVALGEQQWKIDLTLTNRDVMGFRMLLGREAIRGRFLVNPGKSYVISRG